MAGLIPRGIEATPRAGGGVAVRTAGPEDLRAALQDTRDRTMAFFERLCTALGEPGLHIAFDPVLNLPLWELGHLGWFEEFWIARHAGRRHGANADPTSPRGASLLPGADALYDSTRIEHASRWRLALPDVQATLDYLARVREQTLLLLADSPADDGPLYFFRLALLHEDMHHEAWHFMAQRLGLDAASADAAAGPRPSPAEGEWAVPAGRHRLGHEGPGFAFDNELGVHEVELEAFRIDRAPVAWRRYLPFVEASGRAAPPHLRRVGAVWHQQRFGTWAPLDLDTPAMHLGADDAEAWCRWAGRRLPTEAEWEYAATLAAAQGDVFEWGQVWEWTASPFAPYPGFVPHPYREYSGPWFDGRPVLRGASFATSAHLVHARYRNFFPTGRTDVFAGFRSCAAVDAV